MTKIIWVASKGVNDGDALFAIFVSESKRNVALRNFVNKTMDGFSPRPSGQSINSSYPTASGSQLVPAPESSLGWSQHITCKICANCS